MLSRRERGFTLVELMVVVVILGTLIALVGPNIWRMLSSSNVSVAETQMSAFGTAINVYRLEKKKVPNSLEELTEEDAGGEPFMSTIPSDPWDNPYEYRMLDRKSFQIRSYGEDGQPDTEDDIYFPKQEK